MRPSRGMGAIMPSKMGKGVKKARRDDTDFTQYAEGGKVGLYENIHKKRARMVAGSGEKMRKPGSKGAPTKADFIKSAKTAKKGSR
jgi:hypothetical protein